MKALTTYDFYCSEYQGALVPHEKFDGIVRRASAYVDRMTFGRIHEDTMITQDMQAACCAICDVIYQRMDEEGRDAQPIARERIEQHEIQYAQAEPKSIDRAAYDAAALYLWDTGLLSAATAYREV